MITKCYEFTILTVSKLYTKITFDLLFSGADKNTAEMFVFGQNIPFECEYCFVAASLVMRTKADSTCLLQKLFFYLHNMPAG